MANASVDVKMRMDGKHFLLSGGNASYQNIKPGPSTWTRQQTDQYDKKTMRIGIC